MKLLLANSFVGCLSPIVPITTAHGCVPFSKFSFFSWCARWLLANGRANSKFDDLSRRNLLRFHVVVFVQGAASGNKSAIE